jgi:hypothetical protein
VDCGCSQRTTARTSDTARIIPATLASGSIFGCFATDTVARLHRQRNVETELALDAPGPREQEIQRLSLTCAVHPYQPRSPVTALSAQVYRCGCMPPEALDSQ